MWLFEPRSGYALQPRVAAPATLGPRGRTFINRNAVASLHPGDSHHRRNRVAVGEPNVSFPRVAEAATLG
jgi:hypothetical protein